MSVTVFGRGPSRRTGESSPHLLRKSTKSIRCPYKVATSVFGRCAVWKCCCGLSVAGTSAHPHSNIAGRSPNCETLSFGASCTLGLPEGQVCKSWTRSGGHSTAPRRNPRSEGRWHLLGLEREGSGEELRMLSPCLSIIPPFFLSNTTERAKRASHHGRL